MTRSVSNAEHPRRRWFQVSLRGLLIAVTVFGLVTWWLARPTILAHQFARTMAAHDYEKAKSLFVNGDEHSLSADLLPCPSFLSDQQLQGTKVVIQPITFRQVISTERYIDMDVPYGERQGELDYQLRVVATPLGLVIFAWSS